MVRYKRKSLLDYYLLILAILLIVITCFSPRHVKAQGGAGKITSEKNNQDPSNYSDSLILYSGSYNVLYSKFKGTDQFTYELSVKYPASNVITWISKQLKKKGWQALKKDYLNPDLPSSHVKGWTDFVDATSKTNIKVHQWLAQWKNEQKDIVWYSFQYIYPLISNPNLSTLKITAGYVPAKIAKFMIEEIQKEESQAPVNTKEFSR